MWAIQLPDGSRWRLAGRDCPVLVAPVGLPHCLDSLRRGVGFSCPVGEPVPCHAAAAWLLATHRHGFEYRRM